MRCILIPGFSFIMFRLLNVAGQYVEEFFLSKPFFRVKLWNNEQIYLYNILAYKDITYPYLYMYILVNLFKNIDLKE